MNFFDPLCKRLQYSTGIDRNMRPQGDKKMKTTSREKAKKSDFVNGMEKKAVAGFLTAVVFLAGQIWPQALVSFASEPLLDPSASSQVPATAYDPKAKMAQSPATFAEDIPFVNPDHPLSLPMAEAAQLEKEKSNLENQVRDLPEYSFEQALDYLTPDYAAAVMVQSLSASNLRQLTELKIEVGVAVIRGEIVLFTSGGSEEIRLLPAAKDLLAQASLVAHTHPQGERTTPSLTDFSEADTNVEYLVSSAGVYAYNRDGLISSAASDYGSLVREIKKVTQPDASTKQTRDLLNAFIKAVDDYNRDRQNSELFRSADPATVFPGQPVLTTAASGNYITIDQYSSSYFRMNYTDTIGNSVSGVINFAVSPQGPQNLNSFVKFTFEMKLSNDCLQNLAYPCVRVDFMDTAGRVASAFIKEGLNMNFNQFDITRSQLLASNPVLDLTRVKQINFVIAAGSVTQGSSFLEVKTGGLRYSPALSAEGYPILSGQAYNPIGITALPQHPFLSTAAQNGATITQDQSSSQKYFFTYKVSDGDDLATSQIDFPSPQNMGTSITLALSGPIGRQIKAQVIDATGRAANFYLNLQSFKQNFTFPLTGAALPTGFDPTKISQIKLIADQAHSGSFFNNPEMVYIETSGLAFVINGAPYNAGGITALPGNPNLNARGVNGGTLTQGQTSSNNFSFNYNLPADQDSVISEITWGSFINGVFQGAPGPCGGSSSGIILAAQGPAGKRLKVQIVDVNSQVAEYYLFLTGALQNYGLPTSAGILPAGFDINRVAAIRFVADKAQMGTNGTVAIETKGLAEPGIQPSTALGPFQLRPLPQTQSPSGKIFPQPVPIAPIGAQATVSSVNRGGSLAYSTGAPGWAGAGFTYDDFTTAGIETGNLSQLGKFLFSLKGNPAQVKVEVVDDQNRKASVKLGGARSDLEQVWSIPTSVFLGVDLSKVRVIYFIVEGLNQTGTLEIFQYPPGSAMPLPSNSFSTADITNLPGQLQKDHMAPLGADSGGPGTERGAIFNYTTGTGGWAAGGFRYDNFQTPQIETGDISGLRSLIFGLKGTAPQVKFEVVDDQNRKTAIYLRGIRADVEQVWKIETSMIASYGVDLTKVRAFWFVVEGLNQTGSLEINRVPTPLLPNTTASITPLPGSPRVVRVAPAGVTANVSTITRGARLDYNTTTAGWAGGGFSYDDPATPAIESANLSSFPYLVFGLKGNPTQVKFEVVDIYGRKASIKLSGIRPDLEQRWAIPTLTLANYGVDLTKIQLIYFIVEGANQSGSLEIYRIP